jgi:hypothetical protein
MADALSSASFLALISSSTRCNNAGIAVALSGSEMMRIVM